jgi:hypothetical protein
MYYDPAHAVKRKFSYVMHSVEYFWIFMLIL